MASVVDEFKKQHLDNYKKAVKEVINNNTKALVDGDILSLVKNPPLDSMDLLKSKLISLAKHEKIILNSDKLENILNGFRLEFGLSLVELKDLRNDYLNGLVDCFSPTRETELIKINKKDIDIVDKSIKKSIKSSFTNVYNNTLDSKIKDIFPSSIDTVVEDKITKSFTKYVKSTYQKQLNENIAIKVLIKDRTLLNGISEQGEHYLFTKTNSHIFDDEKGNAKK